MDRGERSRGLLHVASPRITDQGIENLRYVHRLRFLTLQVPMTDAALVHLRHLRMLKTLNLQGTRVTPEGIAELQRALPDTTIISP